MIRRTLLKAANAGLQSTKRFTKKFATQAKSDKHSTFSSTSFSFEFPGDIPGFWASQSSASKKLWLSGGALLLLFYSSLKVVPAGHIGVVDFFGNVNDKTLTPGIHVVTPLAKVKTFSVQTQATPTQITVPSMEGLAVGLEVNLLYRLDPAAVRNMYLTVGADYKNVVLIPMFHSAIRQITSGYEAKSLYDAHDRHEMEGKVKELIQNSMKARGIIIEETPIKNLKLPVKLEQAIEDKSRAEQESQRMEFVLQKEKAEAQRKAIEAEGISNFQKIVSEGVSENLLRWKGIEATESLAKSANAKVVVIGGKDGLPLILNTSDAMGSSIPLKS